MDDRVFRSFNRFADQTAWLHRAATGYAVFGIVLFALLLLLAWWDARRAADSPVAVAAVTWAGVAPLVGVLAVQLIGSAVDRARPTTVLSGTHLLLDKTADFSFPSDHGTATAAVAVALILAGPFLQKRWYGWGALALAVLLGLTRIYVGAHYPSDVLAGLALGSFIAAALARPARFVLTIVTRATTNTVLRPLVTGRDQASPATANPSHLG